MIDRPIFRLPTEGGKKQTAVSGKCARLEESENQSKKEMTLDFVINIIGQLSKQPLCLFCTYEIISTQK